MNTRAYMIIIQGEIKTSEIMSCVYNRDIRKWEVEFNNGTVSSYAYSEVEKLTEPDVLNPQIEQTGESILSKSFDNIPFVGNDVALAKYLNPSLMHVEESDCKYVPIFPFGCNNSQYKAVKRAMENQISVIQGPPGCELPEKLTLVCS